MKNGLNGFGNNMDLTPCYVSFVSPRDDFGDWDGRDQAMSQELSGVSDVPIGPQTPFFGSGGPVGASNSDPLSDDTSVVDLRGTSAADGNGVVPIDLGSSAISLGGSGVSIAGPDFSPPINPSQVHRGVLIESFTAYSIRPSPPPTKAEVGDFSSHARKIESAPQTSPPSSLLQTISSTRD